MPAYVELDGYIVAVTTERAVGIRKANQPFAELTWLPRTTVEAGDIARKGDTDIAVMEHIAMERGLEY